MHSVKQNSEKATVQNCTREIAARSIVRNRNFNQGMAGPVADKKPRNFPRPRLFAFYPRQFQSLAGDAFPSCVVGHMAAKYQPSNPYRCFAAVSQSSKSAKVAYSIVETRGRSFVSR